MADEIDMTRVICPLHELADPGARGFTMGQGDWPLKGFVVRQGDCVADLEAGGLRGVDEDVRDPAAADEEDAGVPQGGGHPRAARE